MKRIFTKKHALALISSFAVGTGIILACAGDWGPEYGNSSFTPEAFVNSDYKPFFYSQQFYYELNYDTRHDTRFNYSNAKDWSAYLGNKATRTELEYLLEKASATAIDSAYRFITGKAKVLPPSMQSFQLFKKADKKNTAFIEYLTLAKKSEDFAVNNLEYSWDYESKKKPATINVGQLNKELLQGFTQPNDEFLKQRYWFQLERSYFFNQSAQSAIDLFEQHEKAFPKNELYYRTMAYAAGAYYKLKNFSKANYYYSKVYDSCTDLKTVAHYSFHPQEETDWKATLALCLNNDEKATLWQMLGIFYSDDKRAMQEIYTLNPRSEKLDLLLARAINSEEQKFSAWNNDYSSNRLQLKKDTSTNELLALVTRIAQAGNTSKPYLWYIAAGYLNMLNGNTAKAAISYSAAEKKLPKEELVQWQLRLLKLINTIASAPKADKKLENTVLADIEWLRTMKTPDDSFRHATAFEWIKQSMADKYKKQKDFVKAICFSNDLDYYVDSNNVEAMKSFINKAGKTPYELLCANLYALTTNDLLTYQAIRLTFEDKLAEAISKADGLPAGGSLPGNPFNGRLQDCHDCDHEAPQKIKYSRVALIKKMKEMEDKINAGTEVYSNSVLLANAFYNITHYGNARAFYECKVLGSYQYSPFAIDSVYRGLLTDMKLATKYYTMALGAAKTDEQKAKCQYMLAKCERNQWYNKTIYNNNKNEWERNSHQPDFLAWNGFKALKQQYSNTQFYKEAIKECGYFKTYTRK